MRGRALPVLVAGAVSVALVAAGCGSSSTKRPSPASATRSAGGSGSGATATVDTKTDGKLGRILVDSHGRTLYLFAKDTGATSACSGACAQVWPPFTGTPHAGPGVSAAKLSSTKRSGGVAQVVYNGHPLYYYAPDAGASGSVKGEGVTSFGAPWYVLSAAGDKVAGAAPTSSGSSTVAGGY